LNKANKAQIAKDCRPSTIRTTKVPADDASPAVRDAMLAPVPSLRAFAISFSGNLDCADDLVQETRLCVRPTSIRSGRDRTCPPG
jgi:hypothetical protein